jgi:hypothetical protein
MMEKNSAPFTLTTPCANCPFRTDVPAYLRPDRIRQIADDIQADQTFWCHKTVDHDEECDESVIGKRARVCAGMMATVENEGRPGQGMRVGERLGMYSPELLDSAAPVYGSIEEWAVAKGAPPTGV